MGTHTHFEGTDMGYGLGIFLVALGLILALAVDVSVSGVDLKLIGWILALAGLLIVILTAVTLNRRGRSVSRVTHADGSQSVRESRYDDPGPL